MTQLPPKGLRILHVHPGLRPGRTYEENMLPPKQQELGHDVHLATVVHGAKDVEMKGVQIHDLRPRRIPGFEKPFLSGLANVIRRVDPSVIHCHGMWAPSTLQVASYQFGGPLVIDEHTDNGNLPRGPSKNLKFMIARRLVRKLTPRNTQFVGVNPYATELLTGLGCPKRLTSTIPLSVSSEEFASARNGNNAQRNRFRAALGVNTDEVLIVTSGRLVKGKGLAMLLRAMARLQDPRQGPATRLLIVGDGAERENLTHKAQVLGIADKVIFYGWTDQQVLGQLYRAADFGVLPGKLGGQKDILAAGTPLLVPDHPATRYLVAGGEGLTFCDGSISSLQDCMHKMCDDESMRESMRRQACATAEGRLHWRENALAWNKVYQNARHPIDGAFPNDT